jgi:hypothetical protein
MEATNVQNVQNLQNPPALLMLDEPRVIALRDGKRSYTFYFRRITQADWLNYFNGLYLATRNDGASQLNTTDVQTAGIELFESTVTKVVGYSRELATPADFKKVLPRHSIPVSWVLRTVLVSSVEDEKPIDCDSVEARIDAMWSQTKSGDETALWPGLLHRFTPPSLEQKKRFMRGGAVSRVIGGTRKGATTIYSLKNKLLLELYDELIQSVEGYGVAGKPLEGVEQVRREMDAYHKVEAVAQLFNTVEAQPEVAEAA